MKYLKYQEKAIKEIVETSTKYLYDEDSKLIIFQAPTGAGKTIMLAIALSQIAKELKGKKEISFVWISVNRLHEQSKEKLENYFKTERLLECINITEIQNNLINDNQILFVNWESLNRKGNIFMLDNEMDWNLSKVTENTKDESREIVLIIDESHRAAKTSKAKDIINIIDPNLTIEVSATPKEGITNDHKVTVKLNDVIEEEMIKKEIRINPGLNNIETNEDIIRASLRKRKELQKYYKEANTSINPLLLIQIPRKTARDIRNPEDIIIELLHKQDITFDNRKLALRLEKKANKINIDGLKEYDSEVEVLIFKESIALGWDCPRASILLLQREWNPDNYVFNIQTLGRIMRMPEQKHYDNYPSLNIGYVYTASNNFSIVEDLAGGYVSKAQMFRDNTIYGNIFLPSEHIRRKREKTRLSGDFKKCFLETCMHSLDKTKINTGTVYFKKKIGINGEVKILDLKQQTVDFKKVIEILKNKEEIFSEYNEFISKNTYPYAPKDSTSILKSSIRALFKNLYNIDNEDLIGKIVLNPKNKSEIEQLISVAKQEYTNLPDKEDFLNENVDWQVPESISVYENYIKPKINNKIIEKSVIKPFYLKIDKNNKLLWSKPEKGFIINLEDTDDDVLWWLKNGDRESKYFGIAYKKDDGHYYGFYPDFIIKTKKDIVIIEIKDDGDFKYENILKLNAGKSYQKKYKGKENLYFFIISPVDYFSFFKCLKEQNLPKFKSLYEENLLRLSQSLKITFPKSTKLPNGTEEDQELFAFYEEEISKAINNLDDKKLENEILKIDLKNAHKIIKELKTSFNYRKISDAKDKPNIKIPTPFNICILGEVIEENIIINKLQKYLAKHGLKATDWDLTFYNNTKIRNSDVLNKFKKGQSKYSIIITGQIYHHSFKGNKSKNIFSELKKPKYIDHIMGCSPEKLEMYFNIN